MNAILLFHKIDWDYFEKEFGELYSGKGRLAHLIRLMTPLLILKAMYDLSDEKLVEESRGFRGSFVFNRTDGCIL